MSFNNTLYLKPLEELQRRLGGKCGENKRCCPYFITKGLWICKDCVEMFKDIADLQKEVGESEKSHVNPCPCCSKQLSSEVVIARLEELIEELREELIEGEK